MKGFLIIVSVVVLVVLIWIGYLTYGMYHVQQNRQVASSELMPASVSCKQEIAVAFKSIKFITKLMPFINTFGIMMCENRHKHMRMKATITS